MIEKFESFNRKKVLILHGLGGEPSPHRKSTIECYGYQVEYPHMDFDKEWDLDKCKDLFNKTVNLAKDCNLIIGISLGGYLANLVANHLGKNCILINPAIDRSKTRLDIKEFDCPKKFNNCNLEVFLGRLDNLVKPYITTNFIKENNIKCKVQFIENMEHRCDNQNFYEILEKSELIKNKYE